MSLKATSSIAGRERGETPGSRGNGMPTLTGSNPSAIRYDPFSVGRSFRKQVGGCRRESSLHPTLLNSSLWGTAIDIRRPISRVASARDRFLSSQTPPLLLKPSAYFCRRIVAFAQSSRSQSI